MKTTVNFFTVCVTAILSTAFVSCDKNEGDTTKPVINLHEPENGDVLTINGNVHLDMELSDDLMLKEYQVDIHPSSDGHTHSKAGSSETVDFYFKQSWDVSNKKNTAIHHHEIMIPANTTPGDYHFMVYCTDAAGNETLVVRSVELSAEGGEEHNH
jgi:hypothetical protein